MTASSLQNRKSKDRNILFSKKNQFISWLLVMRYKHQLIQICIRNLAVVFVLAKTLTRQQRQLQQASLHSTPSIQLPQCLSTVRISRCDQGVMPVSVRTHFLPSSQLYWYDPSTFFENSWQSRCYQYCRFALSATFFSQAKSDSRPLPPVTSPKI